MNGQTHALRGRRGAIIQVTFEADEHARWIEAIAERGDRDAFARLFVFYAPRLKSYLMRGGATPGAAEDFAQDAMLTVWNKAALFDADKASAATWIYVIARNRRLDALRRDRLPMPAPELELALEAPALPDANINAAEDAERVRRALARLPSDQQAVLALAFFSDHPYAEVARQLDLPLGTVKSRIRKGMIRLRRLLKSRDGGRA